MIIKLVSCSIVLLLVIFMGDALERRNLMMKPKGTVKTIQSIEDGDTIDCVDYYQQPAFDNPILNKSKVHPSYIPSGIKKSNNSGIKLRQTWHKYGSCPDGTVPIRRGRNNRRFPKFSIPPGSGKHEWATVYQKGTFYGAVATINLWNPQVESASEFSLSQIWVTAGMGTPQGNAVEAGWTVYPGRYGDARTRFFVFMTNDNYGEKHCYDLDCNNFVQNTESRVIVGSSFDYVSTIDGHQYDMELGIEKNAYGNWCVYLNGDFVGHWEGSLFTSLANRADEVVWGGEIVNEGRSGVHTTTHMGSGRFPVEGLNNASYFRNVRVADIDRGWVDASFDDNKVTKPLCYDLTVKPPGTDWGTYFLYGGPGFNDPQCIEY